MGPIRGGIGREQHGDLLNDIPVSFLPLTADCWAPARHAINALS
jgi:hypothetical protein